MTIFFNNSHYDSAQIFSNLSPKDLGKTVQVCKEWNNIFSSDRAWNHLKLYPENPFGIKECISIKFQELKPILDKLKTFPKELPNYHTGVVPSAVSENANWKKYSERESTLFVFLQEDYTEFNDPTKILSSMALVAIAIKKIIHFAPTGLTSLGQAEELALKTKDTFRNSEPFKILALEYEKVGNTEKASEMKKMVDSIEDTRV